VSLAGTSVHLCDDRYHDRFGYESGRGYAGTRFFRVYTDDPVAALTAPGVPGKGDAWSTAFPGVIVQSLDSEYEGGRSDTDRVGRCLVRVNYAAPSGRLGQPPANAALAYTEQEVQVGSVHVVYPVGELRPGEMGPPDSTPIAGGRGCDIETVSVGCKVHRFFPLSAPPDLADWLPLVGKLNRNTLLLPGLLGTSTTVAIEPYQARYRAPSMTRDGDLIRLTHELVIAPDHDVYYFLEDDKGLPVGDVRAARVYLSTDFPAL
jgi:hypothetical protein